MSNNKQNKPRVAIYDFTDCEGCEVKLVSIREKLLLLEKKIDIVNWRLGQEHFEPGPYLLTIIEGTPVTQHEINLLKELRENSAILVALGACAALGGVPAIMPEKDRKVWYEKIYTSQYRPKGIDAVPLNAYVNVDFAIHGCPVDEDEVVKDIEDLLSGKTPRYRDYSVCFECKQAGNPCRIAEEKKPCLGPITQGGCKAVCISGGSPCYGCFGVREEANIPALMKILNKITNKATIKRYLSMFHSRTEELKDRD
jgi:coenzyme F420-reducing hydrogenase gamma subunit